MISKAFSDNKPINRIELQGENIYNCRICDNVVELSQDGSTTYQFDSYRNIFSAKTYEELLVGIIHTRYSYDDETNLINDYILRGPNEKFQKYRDFVDWAKKTAKELKGVR